MKRAFALLLALVMVLSLGVTAFAAEDTGSITITNPTKGHTYRLYKIFEATYLPDGDDADTKPDAVSYTLTDTAIYNYMFGEGVEGVTVNTEKGTRSNALFTYTDETKLIVRNEGTQNSDIFAYLTTMIRTLDPNGTKYLRIAEDVQVETVVFDNLPYGYYLIDKQGTDVAVTITSNTPDVEVIDKNQKPGSDFSKLVWDEDKEEWVVNSSANIGDLVKFKVEFEATNYDGEGQIKYYSIMDTKGDALWVEFNTIEVWVDGVRLERGHYHGTQGTHATGEWTWLGNWGDVEKTPDNAQWYLVHYGFDQFEIVIPWMTNHDFTGTTNGFTLTFGEGAESRYESPVDVVIKYDASVEPGATIGQATNNNLWNKAELSWTHNTTDGPDDPSTTTVTTYALGLNKIDADTKAPLADADFTVWRDEACTIPVYVIPTDIKGVYILDDLNTNVSGEYRDTSRGKYEDYLEDYLGENYETTQKNVVTSEVNGKLVILGLEAGDYYLKETKAPDSYNILPAPHKVSVGQTNNTFFVVHDANGNVVNAQEAEEGYKKTSYTATSTTVENNRGVELPSTGGMGTMMLITFGTMVAMAFGVLLITQKKMSIYRD